MVVIAIFCNSRSYIRSSDVISGRNSSCAGSNTKASNTSTGETGTGDSLVAGDRQRKDGGSDLTTRCNDRAYNGGCIPIGSHPATNCGDEHVDWSIDCEQHCFYLSLLACLLHRCIPIGVQGLLR